MQQSLLKRPLVVFDIVWFVCCCFLPGNETLRWYLKAATTHSDTEDVAIKAKNYVLVICKNKQQKQKRIMAVNHNNIFSSKLCFVFSPLAIISLLHPSSPASSVNACRTLARVTSLLELPPSAVRLVSWSSTNSTCPMPSMVSMFTWSASTSARWGEVAVKSPFVMKTEWLNIRKQTT